MDHTCSEIAGLLLILRDVTDERTAQGLADRMLHALELSSDLVTMLGSARSAARLSEIRRAVRAEGVWHGELELADHHVPKPSVNFSGRQLAHPAIFEQITEALQIAGLLGSGRDRRDGSDAGR